MYQLLYHTVVSRARALRVPFFWFSVRIGFSFDNSVGVCVKLCVSVCRARAAPTALPTDYSPGSRVVGPRTTRGSPWRGVATPSQPAVMALHGSCARCVCVPPQMSPRGVPCIFEHVSCNISHRRTRFHTCSIWQGAHAQTDTTVRRTPFSGGHVAHPQNHAACRLCLFDGLHACSIIGWLSRPNSAARLRSCAAPIERRSEVTQKFESGTPACSIF